MNFIPLGCIVMILFIVIAACMTVIEPELVAAYNELLSITAILLVGGFAVVFILSLWYEHR